MEQKVILTRLNTKVRELEAKTMELQNQYSKFVSTLNHIFSQIMNPAELTRRTE